MNAGRFECGRRRYRTADPRALIAIARSTFVRRSSESKSDDAIRNLPNVMSLENAQYDRADKGKGDVRGHNTQSTEERTKGCHGNAPEVALLNVQGNDRFLVKKVSVAASSPHLGAAQTLVTWLKSRENKALISP